MGHLKARICMSCLGVLVCSVSVGMFRTAALGVDPFQSFMSGLNICIPISFGMLASIYFSGRENRRLHGNGYSKTCSGAYRTAGAEAR